jgi:hypothetical protein
MLASAQRTSRIVFVTLALLLGVLAAVIVSGPADAAGSKARAHTATCPKVKAHGKAKQRVARARARACAARLRRIAAAKRKKTPPPTTTTTTTTTPPPTATSATPPPTTTTTTPPPTTTTPPPTTTTPPPTTTTPPPAPDTLRIGLNANSQGWGTNAGVQQDKATASGVKNLREEFAWSGIEPTNNAWNWSVPDAVVTAGAQRGITILPLLFDTPSWAGPAKTDIPSNPAEYADYVAHVVARYGPGGTFWTSHPTLPANLAPQYFEIWNEPYYPQFSNNHIDPARYANLFKAAVIAGRAANPQAKFILASDTQIQTYTGSWVWWPDAMLDAVPDLGNYIDAIAVHPYSKHYSPDTPLGSYAPDKFLRLTQVHDHFAARGVNKPLWITEVGWSTCTGDTTYCVSESQQASYTATMFQMLHSSSLSYVKAVFLYHMQDLGTDQSNSEMFYGALHQDGSPKPVWNTLKSAVAAG